MIRFFLSLGFMLPLFCLAQTKLNWQNVNSAYGQLPKGVAIYFSNEKIDTALFRAFYVIADLKNKNLEFTTDTSLKRRLNPSGFYEKNKQPLVVVNGTFFSFATNQNLNVVVKEGKILAHNTETIAGRGRDTLTYRHPFASAIGISKRRVADVAWTITDSAAKDVYASQSAIGALKDSGSDHSLNHYLYQTSIITGHSGTLSPSFKKWSMHTAIGGGPVLVQNSEIKISNNEEIKFGGKAINDKHPRTAMGYTADNKLVILVVEGRNPNAGGATLKQLAQILKDLGCVEALNLDGGGSSCLLVNGKETIKPSDKEGQRAVPGVFIIQQPRN